MNGEKLTASAVLINIALFIMKIAAGVYSGSLALISDAFNSFTDIISSVFIHIAVIVSNKQADSDHPFGHDRAEPIAAFISAMFAGVLGFEILKNAIFSESKVIINMQYAVFVLLFTLMIKSILAYLFYKETSPAMRAAAIDSRNDVLTALIALIGVVCSFYGLHFMDRAAAVIISLFIFYTAYRIGIENIDYLMGKSAAQDFLIDVRKLTMKISGIKGINELKAHYVGSRMHVEIHIEVNKGINTKKSHDLGKIVQKKIESMPEVSRAFIHIDPV